MPANRKTRGFRTRLAKIIRFRFRAASKLFKGWWAKRTRREHEFVKNFTIGCSIALVVAVLENRGMLSGIQHSLLDWQISSVRGTSSGDDIAFIDIDEASEASFGEGGSAPYFTPRDKLLELIEAAVAAKASVVVVDIDLSQPPGPGSFADAWREVNGPTQPSGVDAMKRRTIRAMLDEIPNHRRLGPVERFYLGDWDLSRYLARHAHTCARQPLNACVPIVLARTVRVAPGSGPFAPTHEGALARLGTFLFQHEPPPPERMPLRSFLDADLARSPGVLWGSVTFDRDDDYVIRRWRLWQPVCTPPASTGAPRAGPDVLPSSALLAVAFFRSRTGSLPAFDYETFKTSLAKSYAPATCGPEEALPAERSEATPPPVYGISLTREDLPRTLRYRVSWDGGETSLAHVIPAALVANDSLKPNLKIDCSVPGATPYCVRGKIVVIGSTYRDNGDYHRVPGGELPGSIVLINMIDSLALQDHDFNDVPRIYSGLLEVILIILLSLAFLRFENENAVLLVASFAIIVLCLPFSFYVLLKLNLWFDITAPLFGIVLHEAKLGVDRFLRARKASTP